MPYLRSTAFRLARTFRVLATALLCSTCFPVFQLRAQVGSMPPVTFTNPLKDSGADPWVFTWNGTYYYTNTTGRDLTIWKTRDMTGLRAAEKKVVWTPEPDQPWSKDIWAPELYRWNDKWYIYFAADAGQNASHRIFVIENSSADPMDGEWTFKGKVSDATDRWAIDADVFEVNGEHYMVWSGWQGTEDGEQDIFIAHMSDPWTIDSPRTLLSSPDHRWEKHGKLRNGKQVHVNEGPEALIHGRDIFLVYSGSGCWTDNYSLGALRSTIDSNLLEASSWTKLRHPLLQTSGKAHAYSPGHNGFFKSPDGKEDWLIYHANPEPHQGCGGHRSPRIQPFHWNTDGTPDFGKPAPLEQPLPKPSDK
ncbi:MAG TPA: glycoside hydrolase family 43 protein [Bryobacteraceae bacterium]